MSPHSVKTDIDAARVASGIERQRYNM